MALFTARLAFRGMRKGFPYEIADEEVPEWQHCIDRGWLTPHNDDIFVAPPDGEAPPLWADSVDPADHGFVVEHDGPEHLYAESQGIEAGIAIDDET